ncbi:mechanosensitive ion channel family protein [Natronorarus salvus]|uniref:mechanosensitive ion channel family protein n=1 Tax=Natronorarus salvus TaxID=3117733 RepID=UPI002F264850
MTSYTEVVRVVQEELFPSVESMLLVTLLLIASVFLAAWAIRGLERPLERRVGDGLSEAIQASLLTLWIALVTIALTVVWNVTVILDLLVDAILINRAYAVLYLVTAAILVTTYLLIRLVNRSIDELDDAGAITRHQSEVAYHVADAGIFLAGIGLILTIWGVNLTNLILGAGVLSAVLGLAAQKTFSAMIAGFVLLFARPFVVGDWIAVHSDGGERTGVVEDVTILNTKVQTFRDQHVLIPNDEVTSNQLINYSRNDRLRIDIEVGVDYESDLERAQAALREGLADVDLAQETPSPQVVTKRFDDSAIVIELRFWIENPSMRRSWKARTEAMEGIKESFDREGIVIPFSQHVHSFRNGEQLLDGDTAKETSSEVN